MTVSVNTIPSRSIPFTDSEGRISPIWHEFLRSFVSASVEGTIATTGVAGTVTAGAGLTGGGTGNVTLNVGAGNGIAVNADDISVDIINQTSTDIALDDEMILADVSDNNSLKKTQVRNLMGLAAPGGDNTNLQYNSNGAFAGDSNFTTDGVGSVNIVGDLDVDNVNINGNTISITNTNGNLNLAPNGTGYTYMGDNNNTIGWLGGTATTYCFGATAGTPYMRGQSNLYQFITTSAGYSLGVGSGVTWVWSSSTGAMTSTGLDLLMANGAIKRSTVATITASTTQTQGQGALTGDINEISVCANVNDTVTLPLASAGRQCLVINNGAQTLQIFPASGDDLGAGLNTATTTATATRKLFVAFDSVSWEPVI